MVSPDVHLAEALHRLAVPEVVQLEQLAYLDLAFLAVQRGIGKAPGPFHGFFLRFHLDDGVARDQLLCFGEGTVDHGALLSRVLDAPSLRRRLESRGVEQHAGLLQLFVVLRHLAEDLLVRHHARFRVLRGLHDDHESHDSISPSRNRFSCSLNSGLISSFVSANGPSITVRLLPENLTRAPLELACSPSPASITPAFSSSMLNFPISVRIFSSGRTPASESLLALTSTMNRIAVSFLFWVLPRRRASGGEIDAGDEASPPAMAPRTKKGSAPSTTAAGSGASGDSWVRSRSQAKNRRNGRRCRVTWSRIVPRSIGYLASSASRIDALEARPPISSCTSSRTCARVRRCGGGTTRVTPGAVIPPPARPGDPRRRGARCVPDRATGTPC